MKKSIINNTEVSYLGMGSMRFPLEDLWDETSVKSNKVDELVANALKNGITYFDTGFDYHWGESEKLLAKALSRYPRDSYQFATKCPCSDFETDDYTVPDDLIAKQFKRTGLDYFDFYLMHGLRDTNVNWFMDHVDWFVGLKKQGKIKNLGVSCHCTPKVLDKFLDFCGDKLDFVQIIINYYEYYCADGKKMLQLCMARHLPVIAMITLKSGRLAHLTKEELNVFSYANPNYNQLNWAFNFVKTVGLEDVAMILNGMTTVDQINTNVKAIEEIQDLTREELRYCEDVAWMIKDGVPCCGCGECSTVCPQHLDVRKIVQAYKANLFRRGENHGIDIWKAFDVTGTEFPKEYEFNDCLGCGMCETKCQNNIKITEIMASMKRSGENEMCDFFW